MTAGLLKRGPTGRLLMTSDGKLKRCSCCDGRACVLAVCPISGSCPTSYGCLVGPMGFKPLECPCGTFPNPDCDWALHASIRVVGSALFTNSLGQTISGSFDFETNVSGLVSGASFATSTVTVGNIVPATAVGRMHGAVSLGIDLGGSCSESFLTSPNPTCAFGAFACQIRSFTHGSAVRSQLMQVLVQIQPQFFTDIGRTAWLRAGYSWTYAESGAGTGSTTTGSPTGSAGPVSVGDIVSGQPYQMTASGSYDNTVSGRRSQISLTSTLTICPPLSERLGEGGGWPDVDPYDPFDWFVYSLATPEPADWSEVDLAEDFGPGGLL